MNRVIGFCLVSSSCLMLACQNQVSQGEYSDLCTQSWYQSVEKVVASGDGMGHGPDVGSEEWKSVIEFRLGIRGDADLPDRNSMEWCVYVNNLVKADGSIFK